MGASYMNINFFEGGRRILRVTQVSLVLVTVYYCLNLPPIYPLKYELRVPNAGWLRSDYPCRAVDEEILIDKKLNDEVHEIALCFRSADFNGKQLIPYRVLEEEDMIAGDEKTSKNVRNYIAKKMKQFEIPDEDVENFPQVFKNDRFDTQLGFSIVAVLGIFALEILGRLLGWIARGFIAQRPINKA